MKYYVGVDIGGTRIKLGIVSDRGDICIAENEPTETSKEAMIKQVEDFIQRHIHYKIEGVGISTPGIICQDGYMQTSGAIKCFFHHNMKEEFQKRIQVPVVVENDGKAAACAERWLGKAKSIDNFVCLTLGTAIGGAVYINGQLYRGLGGLAGEFGVSLVGTQKGQYDEQSFSYHAATVAGLCRQYSYRIHERVLDAKEILHRANSGDEIAKECLDNFYHSVATLLVNVATILAPEVILIGGGISANEMVMQQIHKAYKKICSEYHVLSLVTMPKVVTCSLLNHAGMIGSVYPFIKDKL